MSTQRPTMHPHPNSSDIILALDRIPNQQGKFAFHWYLWISERANSGYARQDGLRLFIEKDEDGEWTYSKERLNLATSTSVSAAAVIGRLPNNRTTEDLEAVLKKIPMAIPTDVYGRAYLSQFNCRVWVREALKRMDAHKFINCPDVDVMDNEMASYGFNSVTEKVLDPRVKTKLYMARNSRLRSV